VKLTPDYFLSRHAIPIYNFLYQSRTPNMRLRLIPAFLLIFSVTTFAEQLDFRRAIELAIKNSTALAIADAQQSRAQNGYLEVRNQFLPQMTLGSGIAYSNGFPLSIEGSAPSIISVNSTQYLFNAGAHDFLKAAKIDLVASDADKAGHRTDVILETASVYRELDRLTNTLLLLQQQQETAGRVEKVSSDRFQAGIDSQVDVTKARLGSARVRLALAQAQGNADVLRTRLGQLTGLSPDGLETVTESIPKLPEVPQDDVFTRQAAAKNPLVLSANAAADSKSFRAKGEHKQLLPAVDLAGQYGLLARYNNYDEFFNKFQRHNVTVGLVIRFPFLNFAQKAHADAADAEALAAKKQAEQVKNQVTTDTLRMQRVVRQLAAARDVAKLEYQLATADAQAADARASAGQATVKDQENAKLFEGQKYAAFLDAGFELEKAQMELLRATGDLEKWALGK
jgi:outer membrane protein TolC